MTIVIELKETPLSDGRFGLDASCSSPDHKGATKLEMAYADRLRFLILKAIPAIGESLGAIGTIPSDGDPKGN